MIEPLTAEITEMLKEHLSVTQIGPALAFAALAVGIFWLQDHMSNGPLASKQVYEVVFGATFFVALIGK